MKILLALVLSLGAFSAFSIEPTAPEKLTSYLPLGVHSGQNDLGEGCHVFVSEVNYPKKDIQVTAINDGLSLSKLIEEGSEFGYKDYKKEFVQTDRNLIGTDMHSYVERVIRTTTVKAKKLYVVVGYDVVINRDRDSKYVECVVNL